MVGQGTNNEVWEGQEGLSGVPVRNAGEQPYRRASISGSHSAQNGCLPAREERADASTFPWAFSRPSIQACGGDEPPGPAIRLYYLLAANANRGRGQSLAPRLQTALLRNHTPQPGKQPLNPGKQPARLGKQTPQAWKHNPRRRPRETTRTGVTVRDGKNNLRGAVTMCGTQASDRALGLNGDARGWNRPVTAPGPPFNCIQSDCTPAAAPNNPSHSAWALLRSGRPPRRPGNAGIAAHRTRNSVATEDVEPIISPPCTRRASAAGPTPIRTRTTLPSPLLTSRPRRGAFISTGFTASQRAARDDAARHARARVGNPVPRLSGSALRRQQS